MGEPLVSAALAVARSCRGQGEDTTDPGQLPHHQTDPGVQRRYHEERQDERNYEIDVINYCG